jgi:hypothetical protein
METRQALTIMHDHQQELEAVQVRLQYDLKGRKLRMPKTF